MLLGYLPFLVLFGLHWSCQKERKDIISITPQRKTEYLKLNLNSSHQLTVSETEKNNYSITTTGEDPYILSESISKSLHQDSVVLTFEYKTTKQIDKMQFFLGPDFSEKKSVIGLPTTAAQTWKKYSINLMKEIKNFSWGKSGDIIRFDFGNESELKIEIRNIYFRSMNLLEREDYEKEEQQIKADEEIAKSISSYLSNSFSAKISEVNVESLHLSITGNYTGTGKFFLSEVHPNDTMTMALRFKSKIALESSTFNITVDRFTNVNGLNYDRLLSKWVIVKESSSKDEIVSHARYADIVERKQSVNAGVLKSKKGLGGFFINQFQDDLDLLGIHSITINIPITAFMYSAPSANTIPHEYGNRTYYFSNNYLQEVDNALRLASSKDIVVAAIILIQRKIDCADTRIGEILQHPNYTSEGIYTMPNLTTAESINCYAAALDFLATRYIRPDNAYGRIHKWILHNEVDAGLTWTNMGKKPMLQYLDTYIKSMRICHNITRQYDTHSEVMGSFTHSWTEPIELYSSKDMLTSLLQFSTCEGDFQWGIAYHPYPQDLNEPKTWLDSKATFRSNSALVTFKNLEVISHWVNQTQNKYLHSIKRTLWLSENGINSRTYSKTDLSEQAAGLAYAWKKISVLDGIDAMQWHNWIDNRHEYGLRIGLRRFPDDETDPGGKKPVWFIYQAAGTENEDKSFNQYKKIIGINNWSEIIHTIF